MIEEVARLDGVDELPTTLPPRRAVTAARLTHAQRVRRTAEDVLVGCGLHEIAGWSFTEPAVLDRLRLPADSPMRDVVVLENPMSAAQSIMRPSILGSLLDAAAHNIARDQRDLALFESAGVYRNARGADGSGQPVLADEHHALAALLTAREGAGFFDVKGLLATVLDALRVPWSVEAATWPFLHPGAAAAVIAGGERVGFVGVVHPLVARAWDIEQPAAAFAIDLAKVAAAAPEVTTLPRPARVPGRQARPVAVAVVQHVGRRRGRSDRARPAARCSRRSRSSTSTRANRRGRGARRSPCTSSSAPPTGRSTTRRSTG